MRKRNCYIILFFICILLLVFFSFNNSKAFNNKVNIDSILENDDYNYLPDVAKEYIKLIYQETGNILLTERNKEDNVPYLNPEYVEYLVYVNNVEISDDNFDESYDVIPPEMVIDYMYMGGITTFRESVIPTKFDLRNVEGKNFVTPVKDQKSTGLCWSFATNAQAESYLLVKNNSSFVNGVSKIFSEMQIDYATANNAIEDGAARYSFDRILGDAGNFRYAIAVMQDGLGMVDVTWRDFNDYDYRKIEKNKVYKFDNSNFEVTATVNYPKLNLNELDLTDEEDVLIRKNYLDTLKMLIMENGGAYVGTGDPVSRCSISKNGHRLLYDDGKCASGGHAMQIIGWDDDFEYSFCSGQKDNQGYYYLGSASSCDNGTVVTGKGAWLLKNSWGSLQPYVYLAYDSVGSDIHMITDMETKNWDNNYILKKNKDYVFEVNSMVSERLNKIKFEASNQYTDYEICVGNKLDKLDKCQYVTSVFPGLYTVDFSDENILFDSKLIIKISSDFYSSYNSQISVYTDTVDKTPKLITDDVYYEPSLTNIDKYIFRINSKSVNIPENSYVTYKVLDHENKEITTSYTYSENYVFSNEVFSKLEIEKDLPLGTYKLQSIFNGEVLYESNIVIENKIVTIEGNGTEKDPYIINTPSQLNLMRLDRFAYYKLGQDIDLTYDTQNENGLFYNDGLGWEPIRYSKSSKNNSYYLYFDKGFSGGFDGNNHKIIGLYINRPEEDGVGLFSNTYNENYSNLYIKNVVLVEPQVTGNDWVGSILGVAQGTTYERLLDISNIQVVGGSIIGNNYVGGVVGLVNAGSHFKINGTNDSRHKISNLYNSASIESDNYAGGIFGMIANINLYGANKSPINILNVLNKGNVVSKKNAGGIVGYIITRVINDISISNSINTGVIFGGHCSNAITCGVADNLAGKINLTNIYFTNELEFAFDNENVIISNVLKKSVSDIKDYSNYTSWNSFDENWKIENVDNIVRMPVLNGIDFDYTSINDINISVGDEINIYDLIEPNYDCAKNVYYEISDESLISVDDNGLLQGIKHGDTTIHIVSYYDGYETDIKINILKKKSMIMFDVNGGTAVDSISGYVGDKVIAPDAPEKKHYIFGGWYLDNDTFNNKYVFDVVPEFDITLYAKWISLDFVINNYVVEDKIISNIVNNTSLKNHLKNFNYNKEFEVKYYNFKDELVNSDDAIVGTGSRIGFYYNNVLVKEFINIVKADITGDGMVNLADLSKLFNYYRGNITMDDVHLMAADVTNDKNVSLGDLSKLFNYYRGNIKDI